MLEKIIKSEKLPLPVKQALEIVPRTEQPKAEVIPTSEQPSAELVENSVTTTENFSDPQIATINHSARNIYQSTFPTHEVVDLTDQIKTGFQDLRELTQYFDISSNLPSNEAFGNLKRKLVTLAKYSNLNDTDKKYLLGFCEAINQFHDFTRDLETKSEAKLTRFLMVQNLVDLREKYFNNALETFQRLNLKELLLEAKQKQQHSFRIEQLKTRVVETRPKVYMGVIDKDVDEGNDLYITSIGRGYPAQKINLPVIDVRFADFDSCNLRTKGEIDIHRLAVLDHNYVIPTVLGFHCSALCLFDGKGNKLDCSKIKATENSLGICALSNLPEGTSQISYRLTKFEPRLNAYLDAHNYTYRRATDTAFDNLISTSKGLDDKLAVLGAKLSSWQPVYSKHPAVSEILRAAARKDIFYDVMSALGMLGKCDQSAEFLANEINLLGGLALTVAGHVLERNPLTEEINFELSEAHAKTLVQNLSTTKFETIEATSFADTKLTLDYDQISEDLDDVLDLIDKYNSNSEAELIELCQQLASKAETWRRTLADGEINSDHDTTFLSQKSSLDNSLHALDSKFGNKAESLSDKSSSKLIDEIEKAIVDFTTCLLSLTCSDHSNEYKLMRIKIVLKQLMVFNDLKIKEMHTKFSESKNLTIQCAMIRQALIKQIKILLAKPENSTSCQKYIDQAIYTLYSPSGMPMSVEFLPIKDILLEILPKPDLLYSTALDKAELFSKEAVFNYLLGQDDNAQQLIKEMILQKFELSFGEEFYKDIVFKPLLENNLLNTKSQFIRLFKVISKDSIKDLEKALCFAMVSLEKHLGPKVVIEFLTELYEDEGIKSKGLLKKNLETGRYQLSNNCFSLWGYYREIDRLDEEDEKIESFLENPLKFLKTNFVRLDDNLLDNYLILRTAIEFPTKQRVKTMSFSQYSPEDQNTIKLHFQKLCEYSFSSETLHYFDLDSSRSTFLRDDLRQITEREQLTVRNKEFFAACLESIPDIEQVIEKAVEDRLAERIFFKRYDNKDKITAALFFTLMERDKKSLEQLKTFCNQSGGIERINELIDSHDLYEAMKANYQATPDWSYINYYWQSLNPDAKKLFLHRLIGTDYGNYIRRKSDEYLSKIYGSTGGKNGLLDDIYDIYDYSSFAQNSAINNLAYLLKSQLDKTGLKFDLSKLTQSVIKAINLSKGNFDSFLKNFLLPPNIHENSKAPDLRSKFMQVKAPSFWIDFLQKWMLFSVEIQNNPWRNHSQGLSFPHINTLCSAELFIEKLYSSEIFQWQELNSKPINKLAGFVNYSSRASISADEKFDHNKEMPLAQAVGVRLDWKAMARSARTGAAMVRVMQSQEEKKNNAFIVDLDWLASSKVGEGAISSEVEILIKTIYAHLKKESSGELNLHFTYRGQEFASYNRNELQKIFNTIFLSQHFSRGTLLTDFIVEMQDLANHACFIKEQGEGSYQETCPINLNPNMQVGSTTKSKAFNVYVFANDSVRLNKSEQFFDSLLRQGHSMHLLKSA